MNLISYAILLMILVAVVFAVRFCASNHKKQKTLCGGDCSRCNGCK